MEPRLPPVKSHLGEDVDTLYRQHLPDAEGARVFYMEVGEEQRPWLELELGGRSAGTEITSTQDPMAMMKALVMLADLWLTSIHRVQVRTLPMDHPIIQKHKLPFLLALDLRFAARVGIYVEVAARLAKQAAGAVGSGTGQPAPS